MSASSIRDHGLCQALGRYRLCVTPPKSILGPGNLCPQLPSHSAPFYPFFKVSPDASESDLFPTLSLSNLLPSILLSHRFSPLLLKTDQLLCRILRPAGTTAKSAATNHKGLLPLHSLHKQGPFRGWRNCKAHCPSSQPSLH